MNFDSSCMYGETCYSSIFEKKEIFFFYKIANLSLSTCALIFFRAKKLFASSYIKKTYLENNIVVELYFDKKNIAIFNFIRIKHPINF